MKMKVFIFVIVLSILDVQLGFAHPASKVNVTYHLEDHILIIVAEHDTKDVIKHRIDQIIVQLNGNEIIQQTFAIQLDQEKQKATYFIPEAKEGDEIVVITRCSMYGKKKAKIKIESE